MKKIIFGLAALMVLGSCKKESTPAPVNSVDTPVFLKTSNVNGDITITYNADKTVATITRITNGYTWVKEFTYAPGKVTYIWRNNGKIGQTGEFTMVNGRATKLARTEYDAYEVPAYTITYTYQYNAAGLLEKVLSSNGYDRVYTHDANGNAIEMTWYVQGQANEKLLYTYYDKKDKFPAIGFWDDYGDGFFVPAPSKNLVKTVEKTILATNTVDYKIKYNYQFDSMDRVINGSTEVMVGNYGSYSWVNTYY